MSDLNVRQLKGRGVPVAGDDMDTDRIIPARYLKEITFSNMGDYPFYDERFQADGTPKDHPFNQEKYQGASILIANVNFGCGSSREHAPQSLRRWGQPAHPGIRAVVAESYAEIFAGNCNMLGMAAVTASKSDVARLQQIAAEQPQLEMEIDLEALQIKAGDFTAPIAISAPKRKALLEGTWDSTGLLMANADKVKETAAKLPYMTNYA
jgi:3-isopropylmalate/(R)-2-methylmalate dehydratase small subunit